MKLLILIFLVPTFALAKEISLSFDDAPRGNGKYFTGVERSKELIKSLKASNVKQVVFYVNPGKVKTGADLVRLKEYQKSGHLIGNHTFDHISADKSSFDEFWNNFIKADSFLRKEKLLTPYFRYPYLKRGKTIDRVRRIKEGIARKGYTDGYVTIDNYDWYLNSLFQQALRNGKKINYSKLKKFYIETLMKSIEFYDQLAIKVLGRSPKHVLLLHENDLAALFINDLVDHLRSKKWDIISPKESYSDSDLVKYPDVVQHGQGRVVSKAMELGYQGDLRSGYEDEKTLERLFKASGVVSE